MLRFQASCWFDEIEFFFRLFLFSVGIRPSWSISSIPVPRPQNLTFEVICSSSVDFYEKKLTSLILLEFVLVSSNMKPQKVFLLPYDRMLEDRFATTTIPVWKKHLLSFLPGKLGVQDYAVVYPPNGRCNFTKILCQGARPFHWFFLYFMFSRCKMEKMFFITPHDYTTSTTFFITFLFLYQQVSYPSTAFLCMVSSLLLFS